MTVFLAWMWDDEGDSELLGVFGSFPDAEGAVVAHDRHDVNGTLYVEEWPVGGGRAIGDVKYEATPDTVPVLAEFKIRDGWERLECAQPGWKLFRKPVTRELPPVDPKLENPSF